MLNRRYILTVLFAVFVILNGQQMEESPGSEIGDAVFRSKFINLPYTLNWGHIQCLAPIFWTGTSIEVNGFLSMLISVGNQQILTLLTSF